jgi:hypothetical protein
MTSCMKLDTVAAQKNNIKCTPQAHITKITYDISSLLTSVVRRVE